MSTIPLPQQLNVEQASPNEAVVTVEPCYPGYGTTLGNALRRVLLSSLPGAAITSVKFDGVPHEFSSIPFVREDSIDIILNLKKVRRACYSDEPITLTLKAKGATVVTAGDFSPNGQVKIANPDHVICTLTDAKATINMEVTVQRGRGYLPVEARDKEKLEIGTIAIDALFTPVMNVGMKVENVRVEQFTNYERLSLTVATDGTISPSEAVAEANRILLEQFGFIAQQESMAAPVVKTDADEAPAKPARKSRAKVVKE
jgi:DNA-directed RNA polymerase subunit alpha